MRQVSVWAWMSCMKDVVGAMLLVWVSIVCVCCGGKSRSTAGETEDNDDSLTINMKQDMSASNQSGAWEDNYVCIPVTDLKDNVIDLVGNQWMLVTAGNARSYNTMTASWGTMGVVWGKPAAMIMIRESRYTYEFLEREQAFTLSFFSESYRPALRVCGTRSGRTSDKVKDAGLTPVQTPSGMMSFGEARMIIECKTMFQQRMDTEHFTPAYKDEIEKEYYATSDASRHQLFVSEIIRVWIKK